MYVLYFFFYRKKKIDFFFWFFVRNFVPNKTFFFFLKYFSRINFVIDEPEELNLKIRQLSRMLKQSKNTIIFTGAGLSTSSGIPAYRGKNSIKNIEKRKKTSFKAHEIITKLVDSKQYIFFEIFFYNILFIASFHKILMDYTLKVVYLKNHYMNYMVIFLWKCVIL
eukprot:GSMAST32.ASY1.ANO1.2664.1 assembled CDS